MTVWYHSRWDEIYIRGSNTMWTIVDDRVVCSILVSDVKNWNAFVYLGDL